jgi:hypothetical protein
VEENKIDKHYAAHAQGDDFITKREGQQIISETVHKL